MLESVLASAFLAALDRLLKDKLGAQEKEIVSQSLAKVAIAYAKGKNVATSELKPVDEMDLEELLKSR
jgi:hypothetical protein